jgi:hypothetical protein
MAFEPRTGAGIRLLDSEPRPEAGIRMNSGRSERSGRSAAAAGVRAGTARSRGPAARFARGSEGAAMKRSPKARSDSAAVWLFEPRTRAGIRLLDSEPRPEAGIRKNSGRSERSGRCAAAAGVRAGTARSRGPSARFARGSEGAAMKRSPKARSDSAAVWLFEPRTGVGIRLLDSEPRPEAGIRMNSGRSERSGRCAAAAGVRAGTARSRGPSARFARGSEGAAMKRSPKARSDSAAVWLFEPWTRAGIRLLDSEPRPEAGIRMNSGRSERSGLAGAIRGAGDASTARQEYPSAL